MCPLLLLQILAITHPSPSLFSPHGLSPSPAPQVFEEYGSCPPTPLFSHNTVPATAGPSLGGPTDPVWVGMVPWKMLHNTMVPPKWSKFLGDAELEMGCWKSQIANIYRHERPLLSPPLTSHQSLTPLCYDFFLRKVCCFILKSGRHCRVSTSNPVPSVTC